MLDCGRVEAGEKVVVIGGGLTGAESAYELAKSGKDVTIIEMRGDEALLDGASLINKFSLQSLLMKNRVKIITNTKLEEITEKGVRTIDRTFNWNEIEADTVVLAIGMKPNKDIVNKLRGSVLPTEVAVIGDCNSIGNVFTAVHQGFDAAINI